MSMLRSSFSMHIASKESEETLQLKNDLRSMVFLYMGKLGEGIHLKCTIRHLVFSKSAAKNPITLLLC